jgi:hypothetical protein
MPGNRSAGRRTQFRPVDILILGALALAGLLAVVFSRRIPGAAILALKDAAVAAAYVGLLAGLRRWAGRVFGFTVRLAGILFVYAYVNVAVADLQQVLYGRWLDDLVLRLEKGLLGFQPVFEMQRLVSRPLTEWLMFVYVIYLPLYVILAAAIYRRKGDKAAEEYLLALGFSNFVCDFGFILFPVAGPFYFLGSQFSVPLQGGFWTGIGEWLRHNAQFIGGTIPSPHCANATVMWIMAFRCRRTWAWLLAPLMLSLYAATVYGRFHYVTDVITGVAAGVLAVSISRRSAKKKRRPDAPGGPISSPAEGADCAS